MATTTLRMDPKLKARLARVAKQSGKSAHSFMLEAIAEVVEDTERRQQFEALADLRRRRFEETGQAIAWKDVRSWLSARATSKRVPLPEAQGVP